MKILTLRKIKLNFQNAKKKLKTKKKIKRNVSIGICSCPKYYFIESKSNVCVLYWILHGVSLKSTLIDFSVFYILHLFFYLIFKHFNFAWFCLLFFIRFIFLNWKFLTKCEFDFFFSPITVEYFGGAANRWP